MKMAGRKTVNKTATIRVAASDLATVVEDAVCLCENAVIVEINESGRQLLGFSGKGTPVGQFFAAFVNSDEKKKLSKSLASLTRSKAAKRLDLVTMTGQVFAADVRATKLQRTKTKDRVLLAIHPVDPDAMLVGPRNPKDHRYRNLIASSTDCVLIVRGGKIAFINQAGMDLLAGDGSRLIGRPFLRLLHPDYKDAIGEDLSGLKDSSAKTHKDDAVIVKAVSEAGDVIDVEVRVWPFGTSTEGAYAIEMRDVTRRIQSAAALREGEERLQSIVDAVADAVISVDERGQIQSFNAAAESLFGRSKGEAKGKLFSSHVPNWATDGTSTATPKPVLGPTTIEISADVLGKAREVEAQRADKSKFPAEITVTSLQQGADSLFTIVTRDISERKEAENAQKLYAAKLEEEVNVRTAELSRLSQETRQILESANEGIIGIDLDGKITLANPTAAEILDRDMHALKGMSVDGACVFGTGSSNAGEPLPLREQLAHGPYYVTHEARLARGDGLSFEAEYAIAPIQEKGKVAGYVLTLRDITERKQTESELQLAATVFEHTSEGLLVANAGERVTKINRAFTAITGFSNADVIGQPLKSVLFFDDKIYRDTMEDLKKDGQVEWEQWCKNKTGDRYAARQALSLVRGQDGAVQQYAAIINDITERKLDEEQIRYQANYDQLTGLPNRALFMDRLSRLVIESRRTKTNVGLMFIDLDGFKAVNDTLGHDAGDLLLKQTADRLGLCVRESDTVARLGGDEFTVIMPLIDNIESTVVVADRILQSLTEPFDLDGEEGRISASIGISIYPDQAADDKQLLHNADVAMFHAKSQGKANYQFYREGLEIEGVPERDTS